MVAFTPLPPERSFDKHFAIFAYVARHARLPLWAHSAGAWQMSLLPLPRSLRNSRETGTRPLLSYNTTPGTAVSRPGARSDPAPGTASAVMRESAAFGHSPSPAPPADGGALWLVCSLRGVSLASKAFSGVILQDVAVCATLASLNLSTKRLASVLPSDIKSFPKPCAATNAAGDRAVAIERGRQASSGACGTDRWCGSTRSWAPGDAGGSRGQEAVFLAEPASGPC